MVAQDFPLGFAVTVYPATGRPPERADACQETIAAPAAFSYRAAPEGGEPGGPTARLIGCVLASAPVAAELAGLTANVYGEPYSRPSIRHDVVAVVQTAPPGLDCTV